MTDRTRAPSAAGGADAPRTDASQTASAGDTDGDREARLVARIRTEIAASGGRITFARFMDLALYEPGLGYYRQPADRPTDAGDYLSAPETHRIFGWTLARQIEETWRRLGARRPFTLLEYGAGSGTLGLAILEGLRRHGSPLLEAIRYEPVELNAYRRADLERRFRAAGLADRLVVEEAEPPRLVVGTVLVNEFLDALPVHRVTVRNGRLFELYVVWRPETDGGAEPGARSGGAGFAEEAGEPSSGALAGRLLDEGVELAEGQVAEVCLALEAWLDEVSHRLARGYLVVVDYGAPAAELYGRLHRAGTLMAYRRHVPGGDPFAAVGAQDLTAHVDFSAVRSLSERRGFRFLGLVSQAEFLIGAGLGMELRDLQASAATTFEDYTRARSGVVRMLDPRSMGRFRVLVAGRDVPPDPLSGLLPPADATARRPDESVQS